MLIGRVGAGQVLVVVAQAVAVTVLTAVTSAQVAEVMHFPPVRQAVAVAILVIGGNRAVIAQLDKLGAMQPGGIAPAYVPVAIAGADAVLGGLPAVVKAIVGHQAGLVAGLRHSHIV